VTQITVPHPVPPWKDPAKKPGDFSAWLAMLCAAAGSAARVSSAPPNADDLTEGANNDLLCDAMHRFVACGSAISLALSWGRGAMAALLLAAGVLFLAVVVSALLEPRLIIGQAVGAADEVWFIPYQNRIG
jgi:hypothetical protein